MLGLFVMVKEKRYLNQKRNIDKGRLRIYTMKELSEPLVDEIKRDFCNVQIGFHIDNCCRHANSGEPDCHIILRCSHSEHQIDIKNVSACHFCNSNYKIITYYRDAYDYKRYITQ